ncbi:transposase [Streptomyces sp. NPDC058107]|uniref:transposase n=1 Tax=Streptomyces sp. NPDC058107 TaxID=3346343 RepID=UPI0036E82713
MLAEIGDDRERFADARAMKAYAGAAPVTRASTTACSRGRSTTHNARSGPPSHWPRSRRTDPGEGLVR